MATIHVCDCCRNGFKSPLRHKFEEPHGTLIEVCDSCAGIHYEVLKVLTEEYNEKLAELRQWLKDETTARFRKYQKKGERE
jgi:hypothetical protein